VITAAVIGRGGLLGSALARELRLRPEWRETVAPAAPWRDGPDAVRAWARDLGEALARDADGGPWSILWTAGAAVTASGRDDVEAELAIVDAVLDGLRGPLAGIAASGTVFVASSAGGIYAGSPEPPYTEDSPARPLSHYGELKLQTESAVTRFTRELGMASLVGRIANLYGPGQRIDKPQGLISHMALARVTPRYASIYVPLDTLRDYLYVGDCARLVLDAMTRLHDTRGHVLKILATGTATSVAALLGYFRVVTKGRPRVVLGSSPTLASLQSLDLRLRSTVWADLDGPAIRMSLPEGIAATVRDVEKAVLRGLGPR
jgi:Nucleoside-diphosphate-sugar epimerases